MKYTFLLLFFFVSLPLISQNLDEMLAELEKDQVQSVIATFKGTRIVNGHSVEVRQKSDFEFLISHRFGRLNSGGYEFFGLDQSNIRMGFEYALTNNFTVAIGRNSYEKTYDSYIKYRLLRQTKEVTSIPVSITLFGSATQKTLKDYPTTNTPDFVNTLAYSGQILIARKFSPIFSLQLSPTIIHFNRVKSIDPNDVFTTALSGRVKLTQRVALNAEYNYVLTPLKSIESENNIAFGIDIETGGHVFQLIFTNSIAMIEKSFVAETTGNFFKGDIHFGFNISRIF